MKKPVVFAIVLAFCVSGMSGCLAQGEDGAGSVPASAQVGTGMQSAPFRLVGKEPALAEALGVQGEDTQGVRAEEMSGRYLFSQASLEAVLDQAQSLRKAIYDGTMIGVFEPQGIHGVWEQALSLPIQFPDENESQENSDRRVVGRLYGVDSSGAVVVAQVAVPKELDDASALRAFLQCADDVQVFQAKLWDSAAGDKLGTALLYAAGQEEGGSLRVSCQVYGQSGPDGDYYSVREFLYAGSEPRHGIESLHTSLMVDGNGAVPYMHGPASGENVTTYEVSLSLPEGADAWHGDLSACSLEAHDTQQGPYWDLAFAGAGPSEAVFEPGVGVKVPAGEAFTVRSENVLQEKKSSVAVEGVLSFRCEPEYVRSGSSAEVQEEG